jgi:hypothetical protein
MMWLVSVWCVLVTSRKWTSLHRFQANEDPSEIIRYWIAAHTRLSPIWGIQHRGT